MKFFYKYIIIIITICLFNTVYSQNIVIQGKILDERNMPLPGVSVRLCEDRNGTTTNNDGYFVLNEIPCESDLLTASFIGYETYTLPIDRSRKEIKIKINMQPTYHVLDEVQVSSNRDQEVRRAQSISVDIIRDDFLREHLSGSLMQTLNRVPGVTSSDIGSGVSKPIIRGLGYYRVVFAMNGIKQSGQFWNSHVGLSVDQQSIYNLEVIKGPSSLRFGSDAIGGVINILPPAIPENGKIRGQVTFTVKSNTQWIGTSARLSGRKKDFFFRTNITHNNFGDVKIPHTDVFYLPAPVSAIEATHKVELGKHVPNTAGRESAFAFTGGIVKPWGNSYFDIAYHHSKIGFFDWIGLQHEDQRNQHLESTRDIRVPYQNVENFSINHFTNRFFGKNKLELALGYQHNISAEHSILSDRTGNRRDDIMHYRNLDNLELLLKLNTVSANAVYSYRAIDNHTLDFVLNTRYEQNSKDGYSHIIPDYNHKSAGTGVIYRYDISDRVIFNSGARIDIHNIDMPETLNPDPQFGDSIFNPDFNSNFYGTAFSTGISYLVSENWLLKANIGKSFRMPSAYELGAYGLHRHEGRFERGDLTINPEEAWQFDIAAELELDNFAFVVSPFANYFTNYLFLNPTPYLRAEGQVYEYQQTVALLYGGEISIFYNFYDNFNLRFAGEYVYTVNMETMRPLPFTPPFSALADISYNIEGIDNNIFKNMRVGFETVLAASQNHTVPNELKTPGYAILNFNFSSDIYLGNQKLSLIFRVRNLTDAKYFNHVSFYRRMRIPEPGRDFQINLQYKF